ncbi:unnamed protein product [Rotaria sp. Silwood1]|nr:unnamed protein product [Rotaria sp. Silwood1]
MITCFKSTLVLILIWYISSVGFALFLQKYFNSVSSYNKNNRDVFSIICIAAFIQNLSCCFGTIIIYVTTILSNQINDDSSTNQPFVTYLASLKSSKRNQIFFIFGGSSHCIGIMIMNLMLTLSNIPCVHTIRALEPLLASILVYFIPMPIKDEHKTESSKIHKTEKWIGIFLMLFGTILATWKSGQCNLLSITILLGILNSFSMIIRNICIQHLTIKSKDIYIQIILFGISTLLSLILLLMSDFSYLLIQKYRILLLLIGLCSFIYNTTSIIVCSQVSLVTHSLITMLKRPILILASTIYFRSYISLMMIIGNLIIVIGILFYKTNSIFVLFMARMKLYLIIIIIIVSTIIIYDTIVIVPSLSYSNHRNSLHINNIKVTKDFPLFYYKPSSMNDNFGDKLSHILVQSILNYNLTVITSVNEKSFCEKPKLLAIGSIIHIACPHDVIWGSGLISASSFISHWKSISNLTIDIRAVRGPRTRNILMSKYNLTVPEIYGDPALLLPYYLTSFKKSTKPIIRRLLILHYIDVYKKSITSGINQIVTVHAFLPWNELLNLIVQSELVISTSLHGIILSEAFGVPARLLKSPLLDLFKFHDYYEGTNRTLRYATTIATAIAMGGENPPKLNLTKLINAFPFDKFQN